MVNTLGPEASSPIPRPHVDGPRRCFNLVVLVLCVRALIPGSMLAAPAPAPVLVSPAMAANNVDPDPTLTWRWLDDLLLNGSFETGLDPGWTVRGTPGTLWQVYSNSTDAYGMGYCWATTVMPNLAYTTNQLIQNLQIPSDATSATLEWKQRIWNLMPATVIGRLRTYLYENGLAILLIDNATGSESIYLPHNWVSRSTNLLDFRGKNLQLVIQADSYSPLASANWYADVDGFKLTCEHPTRPDFQLYVGKQPDLRSADLVTQTNDLSFSAVVLEPSTTYYWRVDAIRDGVTNQSAVSWFRTRQRLLPELRFLGFTGSRVRLGFDSRLNRFYTLEESESLDGNARWLDATVSLAGTGGPMEVEVFYPVTTAFWRVRVSP